MQLWHGLDDVPPTLGRTVVTIGVFDGVHRGHQRIVARAVERARAIDRPAVVVTFDPHPDEVVRPGSHPPLLCTPRRRIELLAELGADAVAVLPFTLEFSRMSPDDFVQAVLVDALHAAVVVVGDNFRFGHRAAGDVATLVELGDKHDFTAEGVPIVANGGVVSSSLVRERLAAGDVAAAAAALGRPHRVEGVVVRGNRRGRDLGFPTANLECPPYTAIPQDGIYAGWLQCPAHADRAHAAVERWPAAISVGNNPHFGDQERSVEAYALDRDDLELYGEHVAVDFAARLRDTRAFPSLEELIAQMRRDVAAAREVVGRRR